MIRRTLLSLATLAAALLCAAPALAQGSSPRPIPDEYIVRWKRAAKPAERAMLRARASAERVREFKFIESEHLRVPPGLSADDVIRRFRDDPRVEYIEPNYEITADLTPNDQRFSELYGMQNTGQTGGTAGADIKATLAWNLFTGDPNLKIGVIDTGVDYNHPDLEANVWTNPGEIAGNAVDDDNNGYVDDVHGYDFVNNDGDPFDDNGHGSHCSGTIAAVGNNSIGVVGVNWNAKIVGIKFLSGSGSGSTAGAISGVQYAVAVGVRLTSNSWGGSGFSQALLDAINAAGASGQLFIAAAGNSSQNTDVTPHYPSSYNSPYIVAVAATDHNDNLASFSNYGATTVDLAAPGVSILSTQPGGGYRLLSGTSMATPHVAGVAALAMGRFPSASNLQIKQLILNAVDVKASLDNRCVTEGRLNAFMTIAEPDSIAPGAVSDLATVNPASNSMGLTWTATGDDGGTGRASSYEIRYSTSPITDEASFLAATLVPGGPDPQPAGSAESFEVLGLGFSTTYHFALRAKDEFGNPGPVSNVPTGTTLGIPNLSASPTSFSASLLSGGQSNQTLTLSNTAAGTLDFTVPTAELQFSQPAPFEPLPLEKGQQDPRVGDPVTSGNGGPDGAGYRWKDSNETGGPAFSWIDISAIGTQIPLTVDDGFSAAIPMGISFPFYGNTFSTLRVHTNGFLSFTTTTGAYDGNQPLPTSGAAADLVAPFWDDLDFRTAQAPNARAYYHSDGTRMVVSWVDVPGYNGVGGPYTFQAILHTSGEIEFQYLSMGSPTNSATTGIQDGTRTIGLNVAFNTSYVQDNLAVRIAQLRQWLTVTPSSGRILAGQSQDLQVKMDATGLFGGDYTGTIHILSNDPDGSPTDLAASLHVTGAPDIAVNPASLDYGQVFVGAHPTRTVTVSNPGTDVLNVTVLSSDPTLTTDVAAFSLAAREARNLVVTYSPATPALLNATLTLQSNDPDTPNLVIPVTGEGVPAPQFSVSPEQLDVTLLTNTATSRTLRVSNSGGSNYVFTAEPIVLAPTGTVTVQGDADNVYVGKDQADALSGPAPLRAGGPDVFGYTYQDSDEPGGPAFSWVDIRPVGTNIPMTGDDVNTGPYPIGFSFPFYGNTFSTFRISTNGFISFTSTLSALSNTSLPNSGGTVPENLLAVWWDDLNFGTVRRAWYHNDGTRLIIQYQDVPRFGTAEATRPNTFQVILYPTGQVVYQYLSITAATLNSYTIGMQNAAKNDGLQVAFNPTVPPGYVKNNLAIRFRPPAKFLTVTPTGGTVPPGGFRDLNVGFNASGLFGGLYQGAVRIRGNDPVLPQRDVPADLTVIGVPDVAVAPPSIDFGTSYIGFPQLRQIAVSNVGTDVLNVSDITFDDVDFGVDQTSFSVPPLGNAVLFVSFNPVAVGSHSATMTIASNDPDTPNMAVPVTGLGLVAPDVRPDPTSVATTINIPGSQTLPLTIHNEGGSDLNFVIGTTVTASSVPVYDELALAKEENDPRPGILGSGGPDVFGYTWRDSDEPGGPAFDWVDITGIGTPIIFTSGDDNNQQGFPLGFDFPFYGTSFNTVNVCTNGWISFTSTSTAFTNQPLPNASTSVPNNLLAAYWDDLNPGTATPRVYRYSDGTRFIVSYVGVPRLSSGGPYTFQIILYPSGRIVYQYLDMQGTRLNEATIGIQNATRTDGLTIVHNANYVHNNLAIEIATVPEYLTVSPTSGTIPAGGSAGIDVTFNTTGLFGGLYNGSLRISSNDPDEAVVTVPTLLTAVGVPDIAASPASLDFGPVYVGLSSDLAVQVRNVGSDVLTVTGGALTNPDYSLVGASFPFSLGKNGSRVLTVRFTPAGACNPCAGSLDLASNDPDAPSLAVPLAGVGVIPPEIGTTPASLRAALATTLGPTAIQTTKTLVIENTGGSDLNWSAQALSALPMSITTESGELAKDDAGTPGAMGAGGPDAFGYRWADSDDPQGTPFSWIDITGIGTPLDPLPGNGDDQNVPGIPLSFPFPFYGGTFNTVNVCTNGWISFSSTQTTLTNVALPNAASSTPNNLIAPFWDDLDPDTTEARIWYHGDASRFVVSYVGVPRFSSGQLYTFQVILYPSGTIDYQYLSMQSGRLNEATIGIQNATKDVGLTVVHNALYVHDNLRVRIANRPGWLTVSPASGVTPAGGRDTVRVGFDATGLADGDHDGTVRIASNDLDEPTLDVPCHLHVGVAAAAFDLDPSSLNRTSGGQWVKGLVTPPTAPPQDIVLGSVRLQRTVPVAPGAPVSYNGGVAEYKFDRTSLQAVLPVGEKVPVEVIGRVADVTWFAGWDTVKVMRPGMRSTALSAHVSRSDGLTRQVQGSSTLSLRFEDPVGAAASWFDLWYSENGGESWTLVEGGIRTRDYLWTAPQSPSQEAMLDLVAYDDSGLMGSFLTPAFEVLGGTPAVETVARPDRLGLRFAGRNPASQAQLQIGVAQAGRVVLQVFDVRGAVVATVADRELEAGWHPLQWDARDAGGRLAEPGLYFLRARTPRETVTSRFVLVR